MTATTTPVMGEIKLCFDSVAVWITSTIWFKTVARNIVPCLLCKILQYTYSIVCWTENKPEYCTMSIFRKKYWAVFSCAGACWRLLSRAEQAPAQKWTHRLPGASRHLRNWKRPRYGTLYGAVICYMALENGTISEISFLKYCVWQWQFMSISSDHITCLTRPTT